MTSQELPLSQGSVLSATEALHKKIKPLFSPPRATVLDPSYGEFALDLTKILDEAREIIQLAHKEGVTLRQQAHQRGFNEGLAEANAALLKAKSEYLALTTRAEGDMVSLALELARKIVGRHIQLEPEIISDMVSKTLELARGRRHIEIFVHPSDLSILKKSEAAFRDVVGDVQLHFVKDPRRPRGGCRIETEAGVIDADLDTQLAIFSQLLGVDVWNLRKDLRHG